MRSNWDRITMSVVYFDQHLGAVHSKCWSLSPLSIASLLLPYCKGDPIIFPISPFETKKGKQKEKLKSVQFAGGSIHLRAIIR